MQENKFENSLKKKILEENELLSLKIKELEKENARISKENQKLKQDLMNSHTFNNTPKKSYSTTNTKFTIFENSPPNFKVPLRKKFK